VVVWQLTWFRYTGPPPLTGCQPIEHMTVCHRTVVCHRTTLLCSFRDFETPQRAPLAGASSVLAWRGATDRRAL